jgi:hypothetical protein
MDCGRRATQRLQQFSSSAPAGAGENTLNLQQSRQPEQSENQPSAPATANSAAKSLHGMHARNMGAGSQPHQSRQPATQSPDPPAPAATAAATATMDGPQATQAGETARKELSQQFADASVAAAATPEAPALDQASGQHRATEARPVTHMQPHQRYPLKGNQEADQQTAQAPAEEMLSAETPEVEDSQLSPVATTPTSGDQTSSGRSRLRKLLPFKGMNHTAFRVGVTGLCILILAGYVTYLNYPSIAVRVAASQANVDASLPEYTPDGYSFNGPITYGDGQLTVTFQKQGNTISLEQSQTQWDSQSLLTNYINRQTSDYETYRENGLTIYTYDNRHAAWVNGGTMYTINSETYLSQQDIVNIASSM